MIDIISKELENLKINDKEKSYENLSEEINKYKKLYHDSQNNLLNYKIYIEKQLQELNEYKKLYQETNTELLKYKNLEQIKYETLDKVSIKNNIDEDDVIIVKKSPSIVLQKIIKNEYEKQENNNCWLNSKYDLINMLKNDYSGRVGERYINEICKITNIPNIYNDDKISKDGGTYDMIINEKKIEIKTARYGLSKSFQHESLRNNSSDFYLFMDVKPNYFYLTVLPSFNLTEKCKIIERTPHCRKGTSDVYKFDFGEKNILKSIIKGYSIKICENTKFIDVKNFILKRIF
jgi:hypothetical protein